MNPVAHTYNFRGTYIITLRVTNSSGTNTTGGYSIVVTN
jgi:PKD repeat protein